MFKIGDKVKVIKAFKNCSELSWISYLMDETIGKIGSIMSIETSDFPDDSSIFEVKFDVPLKKGKYNYDKFYYLPESLKKINARKRFG